VRLTGDAFCESSAAVLVVGADSIDINLAGHGLFTLSGSGGGSDALINAGHDDVTVRNGTIVGRVRLEDASRNLIRDLHAAGGSDVVIIQGGQANEVRASRIFGRAAGIAATGTDGLVVAGNTVSGGFGPGIRVVGDAARILRNEVPLDSSGGFVSGIELTGSGGRVVDNVVTGPWQAGAIALLAGADNVIAENEVAGASDDFTPPGERFGDGIFVGGFTTGTLLGNNLARDNAGDGIQVLSSATRLRDNLATDNGDFGIDAAAGVTDLGGNGANGNGNPLQCRNVFCE
jgi:parallel beta-helix repeat protein